ncbi:MAG: NYN domain-containing protein [Candidatus Hermodarchaeota archaeon]
MLKRLIIFMDHANIFHNLERLKIRINYVKFREVLAKNYHCIGSIIYMGIPQQLLPKKQAFIKYLESQRFVIQAKTIREAPNGKKFQKGIDISIYRDIVELADEDSYEKATLVSGDSDFIDIVVKLRDLEKDIEIWGFCNSISRRLIKEAGEENVHYIDEILNEIKY